MSKPWWYLSPGIHIDRRNSRGIIDYSPQEVGLIEAAYQVRYRKSRIRTSIIDYLHATKNHPSAETVHIAISEQHPKVSFGTVYRNLNILVDQGEARRLESSRGKDRFDAQEELHAHFHCEECGEVFDLPLNEEALSAAEIFAAKSGHMIREHKVDFMGICASCTTSR